MPILEILPHGVEERDFLNGLLRFNIQHVVSRIGENRKRLIYNILHTRNTSLVFDFEAIALVLFITFENEHEAAFIERNDGIGHRASIGG